jgi:hypothetical protein
MENGKSIEVNIKWSAKKVTIIKKDWKYRVSWDNEIYTLNSILDKITFKSKKETITAKAINKVKNIESPLKIKKWLFDWKWKYKVSKDEIIIREKWVERVLTEAEEKVFYSKYGIELIEKHTWTNVIWTLKSLQDKYNLFIDKYLKNKNITEKGMVRKWAEWLWNLAWNQITSPHLLLKEFIKAKGFQQTTKAILFWKHDKAWIWWEKWGPLNSWIGKITINGSLAIIWWIALSDEWKSIDSDPINWTNIALNYLELMYLPIFYTWLIEYFDIDESINDFINN